MINAHNCAHCYDFLQHPGSVSAMAPVNFFFFFGAKHILRYLHTKMVCTTTMVGQMIFSFFVMISKVKNATLTIFHFPKNRTSTPTHLKIPNASRKPVHTITPLRIRQHFMAKEGRRAKLRF